MKINEYFKNIKIKFYNLIAEMEMADPKEISPEDAKSIQELFIKKLQKEVQRLTVAA